MAETLDGFAQRLRELHKQKNLSQTELGHLVVWVHPAERGSPFGRT